VVDQGVRIFQTTNGRECTRIGLSFISVHWCPFVVDQSVRIFQTTNGRECTRIRLVFIRGSGENLREKMRFGVYLVQTKQAAIFAVDGTKLA